MIPLPPLPPWLAPRYALTGFKLSLTALLLMSAIVGCSTQTVRLEGFQIRLPLIGAIGPKGWKPYAQTLEAKIPKLRVQIDQAEARHAATKRAYIEAQEEAARKQAEIVAREIERHERITDEVRRDYQKDIDALRARADRLRRQLQTGASSSSAAGEMSVPSKADATSGVGEAPDCRRFPAPDPITDLKCREIATAQATQLEALIEWLRRLGE